MSCYIARQIAAHCDEPREVECDECASILTLNYDDELECDNGCAIGH